MSKIVMTILLGAALATAALAQSTASQPGMSGQQAQPSAPGQTTQPAVPQRPGEPAAQGQTQGTASASPSAAEAVTKQLAQLLNLSATQSTQVRDVLQDEQTKLIALRDDSTVSPQDKQTRLMEIRRTASTKLMSILTPEQQNKLADAIQKQHQQQQGEQPAPPQQRPPQ